MDSTGTVANSTSLIVGDGGSSGAVLNTSAKPSFTIASTQTLSGIGTVDVGTGKTLTVSGTQSPGNAGTNGGVGTQAVTGNLSHGANSIFNWDLNANSTTTGFDKVTSTGTVAVSTSGTVFNVLLGTSTNLTDAFWNTPGSSKTWSMAAIFGQALTSGSSFASVTSSVSPSIGSFTISGNSLTWTAVPEPTSALAGLLLAAGLLRRRRVR